MINMGQILCVATAAADREMGWERRYMGVGDYGFFWRVEYFTKNIIDHGSEFDQKIG